jgi:lipoprotein-anchoring transpeptidase ErfK/SrfK
LNLPNVVVGNEFIVPQPKLQVTAPTLAAPIIAAPIAVAPSATPSVPVKPVLGEVEFGFEKVPHKTAFGKILELIHHYSLGVFALLFLAVSSSAIIVGSSYWTAHQAVTAPPTKHVFVQPIQGPNTTVQTADLDTTIQTIASQPLSLTIEGKNIPISADTIRGWLKTVSKKSGVSYIHVDQASITKSLNEAVKPYIKAPVNQVATTAADGSQKVLAAGKNGTKLGDITPLVQQLSNGLIPAKGFQLTVPTESQAFAVVTPSSFDKLIEVNVDTKQMWLYEKGQLVRQFPISAGAPLTPTPIGQFQIYSKLAVQDMRGYNANGTKYFQPHVHWINYFLPGGYAVHGNYWRPQSWFGAINSSHGCVSLPDDQAKIVYDWAPLGTTVITHHN